MNRYNRRVLNMCDRVLQFFASLELSSPPPLLVRFEEKVQKMREQLDNQTYGRTASKTHVDAKTVVRELLIQNHLTPLRSAAVALTVEIPGLDKSFILPQLRASQAEFLARARAARRVATQNEVRFIEAGMPEDFLQNLSAGIQAVAECNRKRLDAGELATSCTGELAVLAIECRMLVKQLNAWVLSRYISRPGVIRFWKRVRRIAQPGEVEQEVAPVSSRELKQAA